MEGTLDEGRRTWQVARSAGKRPHWTPRKLPEGVIPKRDYLPGNVTGAWKKTTVKKPSVILRAEPQSTEECGQMNRNTSTTSSHAARFQTQIPAAAGIHCETESAKTQAEHCHGQNPRFAAYIKQPGVAKYLVIWMRRTFTTRWPSEEDHRGDYGWAIDGQAETEWLYSCNPCRNCEVRLATYACSGLCRIPMIWKLCRN